MCLNAGGMGRCDAETETLIPTIGCVFDVAPTVTGGPPFSRTGNDRVECDALVAHTLKGEGFDASEDGTGRGTPLVPVAFQSNQSFDSGNNIDISPTLRVGSGGQGQAPAIAFSYKDSGNDATTDLSPTLRSLGAYDANGGSQMAVAVSLRGREGGGTAELGGDIQNALRASSGGGDKPHVLAAAFKYTMGSKAHGIGYAEEQSPTLDTRPESNAVVTPHMAVRRLTPVECERLQGFPDNYTRIPWRGKPAEECPDGPRYKALGNSMAVPVMRWIGRRIAAHIAEVE